MLINQKLEIPSAADQAGFDHARFVGRPAQLRWNRRGAILRVAANPDSAGAEVFDLVVPVPGLYFQQRSGRKALAVDQLGGCHYSA